MNFAAVFARSPVLLVTGKESAIAAGALKTHDGRVLRQWALWRARHFMAEQAGDLFFEDEKAAADSKTRTLPLMPSAASGRHKQPVRNGQDMSGLD
jgi:hypothetical protein